MPTPLFRLARRGLSAVGLALTFLVAAPSSPAASPWEGSPDHLPYVYGLGFLWDQPYPFVYSFDAGGWLYAHAPEGTAASVYLYWFEGSRWLWHGTSYAPFYYDFGSGGWESGDLPAVPVSGPIAFDHPRLQYFGRVAPDGRCSWTGTGLRFVTDADQLTVQATGSSDWWTVAVDGFEVGTFAVQSGQTAYPLTGLGPGRKTVSLHKRTEGFVGTTQLQGLILPYGTRLEEPPARPTRRLEVIGDSISCGYGNEGTLQDRFLPAQEDGYTTYWSISARELGVEAHAVAVSGRGMYVNYGPSAKPGESTMPTVYDETVIGGRSVPWNFSSFVPDVFVIYLGTNDFSVAAPPWDEFSSVYTTFVDDLLQQNIDAHVYCCSSPGSGANSLARYVQDVVSGLGYPNVHYLEWPASAGNSDFGADYHPSEAMHHKMAAVLTAALRRDLGW